MSVQTDLKWIRENLATKADLRPLAKDIRILKTDVSKIKKDMNMVLGYLDKEYVDLRKRVERIEEHLGLPSLQ